MQKERLIFLTFLSFWALLTPLSYRFFGFYDSGLVAILKTPLNNLTALLFDLETESVLGSDSVSLYLWTVIILAVAVVFGLIFYSKKGSANDSLLFWMERIVLYFLILQLMRYGTDKVFKAQFYLPEPNILATELGQLDKDMLFWSTMGTSYSYNLFLGLTEILAALLLYLRKTRILGLFIALGTIIQILAINFCFDISVKLFSSILFLSVSTLLLPYLNSLYSFLVLGNLTQLPKTKRFNLKTGPTWIKGIVLLLFLFECILPFAKHSHWNDDLVQRPFLHGMYVSSEQKTTIQRVFVHRDGYFIFEDQKGNKIDFALAINEANHTLTLTNYQMKTFCLPYQYNQKRKLLKLTLKGREHKFNYIEWRNFPALQNQWHWTVDGDF